MATPVIPATKFREYFFRISPTWLQGPLGKEFVAATIGLLGDIAQQLGNLGLKAPWLKQSSSPDDALPPVGLGSNLPRYFTDTTDGYRVRLNDRWNTWELAGTKAQLENQAVLMGFPNAQIFEAKDWPLRPPAPYWSQFWLFIPSADHSFTVGGNWDDGALWDDGAAWDIGGVNVTQIVSSLVGAMCLFKPGHTVIREIIFEAAGAVSWDTGHSWDDPGLVWGAVGSNLIVPVNC